MNKDMNKYAAFFKSFSDAEDQLDFRMGDQKESFETISTGSYAIDDCIGGEGGIPKGRITQYYGMAGSGKSMLAILAIKEAQKKDQDSQSVWIDVEGTLDLDWCSTLGVDVSRLIVIDGETAVNGRECFTMLLGEPKEDARTHILKGKLKEGLLDKIINKEFNINIIVLDSLGGLIPPGEDVSNIGKMNISLMARFLSTTLKKLSLEVKKANVAFIIINHKRDSMNPYGPTHTYMGGNSFTHFLSLSLYLETIQRKDAMVIDEKERKVGQSVRASVEKSKSGSQKKCEIKVHFGKGIIDLHEELANLALEYDIVSKPTSMSYEYGNQKWVGAAKFFEAVKNDQNLADELAAKIKEARLNKWKPKELSLVPSEGVVEKTKKSDKNKQEVA